MSEELALIVQAFGGAIDDLSAKLEHTGCTPKTLFPGTAQKICLHLDCHRIVADPEFGFDGKPHRYVGGGHEHLSTHYSVGMLERSTEWYVDGALAVRDGVKRESQLPRECDIAQRCSSSGSLHAKVMKTSVLEERRPCVTTNGVARMEGSEPIVGNPEAIQVDGLSRYGEIGPEWRSRGLLQGVGVMASAGELAIKGDSWVSFDRFSP